MHTLNYRASITDATLASQAALVEQVPVFFWMDVAAKVPTLGEYLAAADAAGGTQVVQAVIYDLPDRDCAAESSAGEYSIADGGAELYQEYIDAIAAQVERVCFYSNLQYNTNLDFRIPECSCCLRRRTRWSRQPRDEPECRKVRQCGEHLHCETA